MIGQRRGVDTRSWSLAELFLSESPGATLDDVRELAEDIQRAIESFLEFNEERLAKEKPHTRGVLKQTPNELKD